MISPPNGSTVHSVVSIARRNAALPVKMVCSTSSISAIAGFMNSDGCTLTMASDSQRREPACEQSQAQAAEETSTSMEEMAASIQTVAGNAQSLATYVEDAARASISEASLWPPLTTMLCRRSRSISASAAAVVNSLVLEAGVNSLAAFCSIP